MPKSDKLDLNCEQCSAHLLYQPGDKHLTCPYCQHEHEIDCADDTTVIKESDLESYLANAEKSAPRETIKTVQCTICSAETTIDENIQSSTCPFCASPILADAAIESRRIQPEYIVPFDLEKNQAETLYKDWIKSLWFAPNAIKKQSNNRTEMKGMYLPFWTYDANTATSYTGQRGDHYYVTQSYTNGKGRRSTRRVRKTRWYPVSGNVSHFFDDVLVAATRSLPTDKLEALEPWNLKNMREYDSRYLVGFITEQHSVSVQEGLASGKGKMNEHIDRLIRRNIGGDEQRISNRRSQYSNLHFKHILLPVWVSSYRFKEKVYQFLVNARTGEVQGQRPWSIVKIASLSLAIIALIAGLIWYGNSA